MGLREIPQVLSLRILRAVVIGLAGQVIRRMAKDVDGAPLPGGLRQHLGDGFFTTRVVVLKTANSTPCRPRSLKAREDVFPERLALAAGEIDGQDLPAPALMDTDRDQTAWERMTPASRTPRSGHRG